jgi:NADPH:quinone reductase-like Zn-dependent oxidoreductase
VLINGAGAIGRFAVQLARHAGAHVVAVSPSRDATVARDAGVPIEPVDAFVHLVPAAPERTALIRPGGVLVSATTPADQLPAGDFRARHFIVRNDTADLAAMLELVATGAVRIDIAARRPLADLAAVHQEAETGRLPGKTLLLPGQARGRSRDPGGGPARARRPGHSADRRQRITRGWRPAGRCCRRWDGTRRWPSR